MNASRSCAKAVVLMCANALALNVSLAQESDEQRSRSCSVNGSEAVNAALAKGFSFKGAIKSGEGSCLRSGASYIVSGSETADVTCELTWFGNKNTKGPWQVVDLVFSGEAYTDTTPQKKESDLSNAVRTVEVSAQKEKSVTITLMTLVLEGGKCIDWKGAF